MIYLDNNATTKPAPEVVEVMLPFFESLYSNPSSPYNFGRQTAVALAEAREKVATMIGCKSDQIIFNSCGSEGNNTILKSIHLMGSKRKIIVSTPIEHKSILNVFNMLQNNGFRVDWLKVDEQGNPDLEHAAELISDDTALVCVMHANNETGVVLPVRAIADLAKSHGALVLSDAVQTAGKIPVQVEELGVDFLTLSAHKLHGPKGVGALYVRDRPSYHPMILGGEQENGRRAGTENVAGIVGFGRASTLALEDLSKRADQQERLRNQLEEEILRRIPDTEVLSQHATRLPNTSGILIPGVETEPLLARLDMVDICCSSGSACSSGAVEASHVISALGKSTGTLQAGVRFSLSRYTTENEIDAVVERLPEIISDLRRMS